MTQTKIFESSTLPGLEESMNDWLGQNHEVRVVVVANSCLLQTKDVAVWWATLVYESTDQPATGKEIKGGEALAGALKQLVEAKKRKSAFR